MDGRFLTFAPMDGCTGLKSAAMDGRFSTFARMDERTYFAANRTAPSRRIVSPLM